MKRLVTYLINVVILMILICSATAKTSLDNEDCGLEFPKIDVNEITVSWKRSCFSDDTSYKIEMVAENPCRKSIFPCEADTCEITISEMNCDGRPLNPCSPASYTVSGNTVDYSETRDTTAAPKFNDADWKLNQTTLDNVKGVLKAKWGPPESTTTDATCATRAIVTATCNGTDPISNMANITDPTVAGTADLNITNCDTGEITVTVTYVSDDDVPTETTKTSEPIDYLPGKKNAGSRNVYTPNVVLYSGIAILFGLLHFNYISC